MKTHPYIGITGVTTVAEAKALAAMIREIGLPGSYKLMLGVLASYRGLAFGELADPAQYVAVDQLDGLMLQDNRLLNLVHYNSSATGLPRQLDDLLRRVVFADGVQLNIAWPAPEQLQRLRWQAYAPVVLQVGREAFLEIGHIGRVVERLRGYAGVVEYVLVDPSGGLGKQFEPDFAVEMVSALVKSRLQMRWGIAGGLGPDNVERLRPLLEIYPELCWDAQAALRTADKTALDLGKCRRFLEASCELLRGFTT